VCEYLGVKMCVWRRYATSHRMYFFFVPLLASPVLCCCCCLPDFTLRFFLSFPFLLHRCVRQEARPHTRTLFFFLLLFVSFQYLLFFSFCLLLFVLFLLHSFLLLLFF
jgi:hypothetical protein